MSSAVESVSENRLRAKSLLGFDLLFGLVPLLLLAPLLGLEFELLWHRPGMTFFPIPIFIVGCFAVWHLRSPRSDQPLRVLLARGLFLVGVGVFGACVWRLSPWLAHGSLVLLFASWAVERLGGVAWPRILAWAALLATSLRLPGDLNSSLQDWLVKQSSATLGCILDGLSVPYLTLADTFNMRGLDFSIRDCSASVYSIHALASAVLLLLVLTHRSLLVAILSLLTVPLWAIVQQVLLLLAVVLLKHFSDRDASQGLDHHLVELASFILVVSCCWASMSFLTRVFLPVPAADSQFEPEFLILNSVLCWPQPDPFAEGGLTRLPTEASIERSMNASRLMQRVSWVAAFGFILLGFLSTHRWAYGGFTSVAPRLPAIYAEPLENIEWKKSFPEAFDRWRMMEAYYQLQRIDGSDRATIHWQFGWQGQIIQLSVALPFNSHPRLASKYEAMGWRVLTDQTKQFVPTSPKLADATGENETRPTLISKEIWTELVISNELGGQAYALVSYHPLLERSETSTPQSENPSKPILEYQVVLFCESGEELTKPQLSELYSGFHLANEHLREEVEPRLRELLGGAQK
jgi:hypothetical protein